MSPKPLSGTLRFSPHHLKPTLNQSSNSEFSEWRYAPFSAKRRNLVRFAEPPRVTLEKLLNPWKVEQGAPVNLRKASSKWFLPGNRISDHKDKEWKRKKNSHFPSCVQTCKRWGFFGEVPWLWNLCCSCSSCKERQHGFNRLANSDNVSRLQKPLASSEEKFTTQAARFRESNVLWRALFVAGNKSLLPQAIHLLKLFRWGVEQVTKPQDVLKGVERDDVRLDLVVKGREYWSQ